ncbi:PPC domain-containing protein [Longimicrobium sp.]|uniref:PPC domain-containing protein n=1 Tax=Longimicrobium sp. TaxID=2029185 RepID=UPI002F91C518
MIKIQRGAAGVAAACLMAACAPSAGAGLQMQPGTAPPIRVGQTVQGTLADTDPSGLERGPFDAYRFDATAGQQLVATMESDTFDTYLTVGRLYGPVMDVVDSDDDGGSGGEGTNSQMRFTVPATGAYVLIAQSFAEEGRGAYTLSLNQAPAPTTGASQAITLGQPVTGEIAETDNVADEDDAFYDAYTFAGRAGQRIAITLESEDFDTYLRVGRMEGGSFEELESDDDGAGGQGTNSMVRMTLEEDGQYVIRVSPLGGGEGAYTLRLEERAAARGPQPAQPLQAGVRAQGVLDEDDPVLESDNSYYDLWSYQGREGEALTIQMMSEDFDTYVAIGRMVNGEWEEVASMDDGGEGTNTLLEVTLPATGEYVIRANSFGAEETGSYTLLVETSRDR